MGTILNLKRHHHVAEVGIFLIAVALIAGMVGCGGAPGVTEYDLTIAGTTGGSTSPAAGTHTYDDGDVVNLVAEAEEGYHFVNWTGDVNTIGNVNGSTTTITMDDHYSITANFEEEEAVTFADPNLEAAIREAVGKPTDPVYLSDLDGLTSLSVSERISLTSPGWSTAPA